MCGGWGGGGVWVCVYLKLSIPYINSHDKCHISAFNALISIEIGTWHWLYTETKKYTLREIQFPKAFHHHAGTVSRIILRGSQK